MNLHNRPDALFSELDHICKVSSISKQKRPDGK